MKKLLIIGFVAVGVFSLVRAKRESAPKLLERMMETGMPKMMDACFAQMDTERRQSMLSHCRGMLDQMEQKYVTAQAG